MNAFDDDDAGDDQETAAPFHLDLNGDDDGGGDDGGDGGDWNGGGDDDGGQDDAADQDDDADSTDPDDPDAADDVDGAGDDDSAVDAEGDPGAADGDGDDGSDDAADDDDADDADGADDGEPLAVDDPDLFSSAADYPDALPEDFEDDTGNWTDDDYAQTAERLFGGNEYFGEAPDQRYRDLGWEPLDTQETARFTDVIAEQTPDAARAVQLFRADDGTIHATGLVTYGMLEMLQHLFPQYDLTLLNVSVPPHPGDDRRADQPLPPLPAAIANIVPADAVDLRKYCSPVGDQGQTMRCSAFAWTHGNELLHRIVGRETPPLACNFTMLQFQRMQGDAQDFEYAFLGGEGTIGGPDPGNVLVAQGTCPATLWSNDEPAPAASEAEMTRQAQGYRLPARILPIALDDLRQVLAAGYPVHLEMNTGSSFSQLGRSGVFETAEGPSGQHGRHAMLLVGYVGNYFIVKNSWGSDWGDQGYAYMPKKVLFGAEADLVALIPTTPVVPIPPPAAATGNPGAAGGRQTGNRRS